MPRLRILAAALGAVALVVTASAVGAPGDGVFRVGCDLSHRLPDDPIVHFKHKGAAHSHEFYGNRSTNANSTLGSLRGAGTTCDQEQDKSGYWIPTLYKYGNPVEADSITAYYRAGGKNPALIQPLPDGLQMIAGDADSKELQDDDFVDWSCARGSAFSDTILGRAGAKPALKDARREVRRLKRLRADASGARKARIKKVLSEAQDDLALAQLDVKPSSLPRCPANSRIHLSLNFPDCWDGRRLDSRDHKKHMRYSEWSDGEARCFPSHPIAVPAITFSISWPVRDGMGARLASGAVRTMHGDVFSAWEPGAQASAVAACLNADIDCD